ncbi:MAG: twin-arginine translocase subunit TatC [Bacteroidaceae bacterium]|nr:twin-arginine translocase subunit TatC [Bacteroidaceae bacterium]
MPFWDHLEVLRKVFLRIIVIALTVAMAAFGFKSLLFNLVLAPSRPDFITYRLFAGIAGLFGADASEVTDFSVDLFSTMLTAQFMIHMRMAFWMGVIITIPYIIYELYGFIAPALKESERRNTVRVILWSYLLFMMGVLLNYFVVFPLAFRFLGTYQVSPDIPNVITISSYVDMLLTLTVMLGIMFELPVLSWFLAKLGFINSGFMKKYRRHAVVVIVALSAIITPTADVFTLAVVSVPIYLLYEASISIVRVTER